MPKPRIAVLFDAENIGCEAATLVLLRLRKRGTVQSACAVGDFLTLKPWIDCGRTHGIDLVMQPSLGKGKNTSDIRLTIEAMELAYRGHVDTIALVSNDRDFTPLAFRLREMGLLVMGFGTIEPSPAFRAACSSFEVVASIVEAPVAQLVSTLRPAAPVPLVLSPSELAILAQIAASACADREIVHMDLTRELVRTAPALAQKLKGKLLRTFLLHNLVERVGSGSNQRLRSAA